MNFNKDKIFDLYRKHVSSGKVDFYQAVGIDLVIGKRSGPWIYDLDGKRRFLNCHCNGGVFNLGHRHPEILKSLEEGLEEGLDIGNHHLVSGYRALLAKELAKHTPSEITRVTYGVSGGEAIDFAIKLARGYTKKYKIIYAKGGYHGHTGLALAAGDEQYKKPFEPLAPGFIPVPFGDTKAVEKAIDNETAAVLFETIPATLGMPLPPDDFYKNIKEICERKDCLLILDEIQTGLGRTGKLWGFENYDVVPDIFVIGKGLSGGLYPITATLYTEDIGSFMKEHPFIHISTFGGSELGCKTALKVLEISSSSSFLEHVNMIAKELNKVLIEIKERYRDILKEIRQKGLFIGLKMSDEGYGPLLSLGAYENGIFAVYANNDTSVLQLLPPLIIGEDEIEYIKRNLDLTYKWAEEHKDYLDIIKMAIRT